MILLHRINEINTIRYKVIGFNLFQYHTTQNLLSQVTQKNKAILSVLFYGEINKTHFLIQRILSCRKSGKRSQLRLRTFERERKQRDAMSFSL